MPDRDANAGPGSPLTPEERAAFIFHMPPEADLRAAIAAAIRAAVADEREACAKVADDYFGDSSNAAVLASVAIRDAILARGQ